MSCPDKGCSVPWGRESCRIYRNYAGKFIMAQNLNELKSLSLFYLYKMGTLLLSVSVVVVAIMKVTQSEYFNLCA